MVVLFFIFIGVAGLTYVAKYLYDFKVYQSITLSLNITNIDLSKVKDGIYWGV
jgi:hypothetical protein